MLHLLWSYDIKTLVYADKARTELAAQYAEQPLLTLIDSPYETLEVQALFIINAVSEPINIDRLNAFVIPIFDAQNILSPVQVTQLTGDYIGIGRKKLRD